MEASSIPAEDEVVGTAPSPLLNEKGYDVGTAVELKNWEGVVEAFRHRTNNLISKADELEQKVNEIVQFYANKRQPNNSKGSSVMKDKDKEKSLGINDSTNTVNNSGSNGKCQEVGGWLSKGSGLLKNNAGAYAPVWHDAEADYTAQVGLAIYETCRS